MVKQLRYSILWVALGPWKEDVATVGERDVEILSAATSNMTSQAAIQSHMFLFSALHQEKEGCYSSTLPSLIFSLLHLHTLSWAHG
jgi:hypothetical protein